MASLVVPECPLTDWQSLADEFYSYLSLSDTEMEQRLEDRIRFEHRLPEPERYLAALLRLESWLDLAVEDARVIAQAYGRALDQLPPEYRLSSQHAERAAVYNGLSFSDFRALAAIVPWFGCEASTLDMHEVLAEVAA